VNINWKYRKNNEKCCLLFVHYFFEIKNLRITFRVIVSQNVFISIVGKNSLIVLDFLKNLYYNYFKLFNLIKSIHSVKLILNE